MIKEKETYEQKKRRLYGKQHLYKYIKELNALTNIDVCNENLFSIVETDKIVSGIKEHLYKSSNTFSKSKILFSDKESLLILIGHIINLKNDEVYISTEFSLDCGLLKLASLNDFNVNFDYEKVTSGLFSITLKDFSNSLLFDFYEEDYEYYLEIESYGKDWSKVSLAPPASL